MWQIQIMCHGIDPTKNLLKEDDQMKTARKILSVIFMAALIMVMCTTVFAAGTGSITITNATTGQSYSAYKVFDLTYVDSNVAYTYTKTGASDSFYNALTDAGSPFILTATTNADVYNVSTNSTAETISAWLDTNKTLLGDAAASQVASSDTVSFTGLDLGYYYVTSGLGSTVTLTSTTPTASIVDKNQKPRPDVNDGYKSIVNGNENVDSISAQYGDTVTFELKATATNYDGETKITEYVAHDQPGTGYSNLTVTSVTVGGTTLAGTAYTASTNNSTGELTVTIPWVDNNQNFLYTTSGTTTADIVVTITATVTNASESRTNTGWFTWTNSTDDPNGHDDVVVSSYKITINKTDSTTNAVLANAQFVLKNSEDKFYNLTNNGVVTWVDAQGDATVCTTNASGVAEITGLKNGTYTVMEIKAPDGYQLPTTGTEVNINNADGTAAITNTKGDTTPLPETGGLGTILFTAFGLIVVITTGIFLVTNKRMSKESI